MYDHDHRFNCFVYTYPSSVAALFVEHVFLKLKNLFNKAPIILISNLEGLGVFNNILLDQYIGSQSCHH